MLPIRSFVRVRGQDETYRPLTMQDLSVQTEKIMGSGAANDPYRLHVTVRNISEEAWHGILKLDVFFSSKEPKFFLPGFLYGTNRGDAPLETDSKAPRLRKSPTAFPASPWWLTRSDRLLETRCPRENVSIRRLWL